MRANTRRTMGGKDVIVYKIQWREYGVTDWSDLLAEEYHRQEHAELRKSSYWEKLGMPLEFRVEKENLHESQQSLPSDL